MRMEVSELNQYFCSRANDFKDDVKRNSFSEKDISVCLRVLMGLHNQLSVYPPVAAANSLQLVTECMRCLRNACAASPANQQKINVPSSSHLLPVTLDIIITINFLKQTVSSNTGVLHIPRHMIMQSLVVCIQFVGNFLTGNEDGVELLWQLKTDQGNDCAQVVGLLSAICYVDDKEDVYEGEEEKRQDLQLCSCAAMLLYNIMLFPVSMEQILAKDRELHVCIEYMLNLYVKHGIEWGFLLASHIMNKALYLHKCLQTLSPTGRGSLLEMLCVHVAADHEEPGPAHIHPSRECVKVMVECLVDRVHADTMSFFKQQTTSLEYIFQQQLLFTLCILSSKPLYCGQLQDNRDLLDAVTYLLLASHELDGGHTASKHELYEMFEKLSLTMDGAGEGGGGDVGGGSVKQMLVRICANLVFRHKDNQDVVRQKGVLSVILSSSQLSPKDPFLRQWCIFAVRNLCEDNFENQRYIGMMTPQTVVCERVASGEGETSRCEENGVGGGGENRLNHHISSDVRSSNEQDIQDLFY